jgi:leucyl aminopeptidase
MGATHLVDVATLTGACVVALGRHTSAIFGTPQWWVDVVARDGRAGRGSAVADAALRRDTRTS